MLALVQVMSLTFIHFAQLVGFGLFLVLFLLFESVVLTWVLGYNKLKQNEMTSNKNKNLVGGDERKIKSFPFSPISLFCHLRLL